MCPLNFVLTYFVLLRVNQCLYFWGFIITKNLNIRSPFVLIKYASTSPSSTLLLLLLVLSNFRQCVYPVVCLLSLYFFFVAITILCSRMSFYLLFPFLLTSFIHNNDVISFDPSFCSIISQSFSNLTL